MSAKRPVTERDFRDPRFRDAVPEDYEFRDDGAIVRKDRWEMAIRRMASSLGLLKEREFEIADVETAVAKMMEKESGSSC